MDILSNSWLVLVKEWNGILGILCIFLLGGGIVFLWLKTLLDDSLTFGEYFVLSVGGAFLPLFLGISLAVLLDFLFDIKINFTVFCSVIFIISGFACYKSGKGHLQTDFSKFYPLLLRQDKTIGLKQLISAIFTHLFRVAPGLVLILILIISLYIRLAFISGLVVPLYYDSATHYSIVQSLIKRFEASSLATFGSLVEGYYHLGFHVLIAAISLALHLDVKDVILIFGQIILAILPLPLFFIVRQETKLDAPGIFAVLLAGWGWSMPAHALDWGKYPALTSILAFEFVLCSLYLVLCSSKRYRWISITVLGLCVLVSTFIHTRSFVLITIAITCCAFSFIWRRLPRLARNIVFFLAIGGVLALIFFIQSKPVLSLVFVPYQPSGLSIILLVLLLIPFAVKEFPATAFSITLSLLFLLGSLFVPVLRFLPGYEGQTLLDRPFVEMFLFFPLAFLGSLGYAGLNRTLNNLNFFRERRKVWMNGFITLLLFGTIFINITQYTFSPSTCCQFFGDDDAVALDWMSRNIPLDANILISSSERSILESTSSSFDGSDGGVWIFPLIQRYSKLLNNQTDFSAQSTLDKLCNLKMTYIYVGGTNDSFDITQLQSRPDWYEMLLLLPKAGVFKIVGCR
jgi:hypothetical protein